MAVTSGILNTNFITATEFLAQREIDKDVYDVARDGSLGDLMRLMDRRVPIKTGQSNFHSFTNQSVFALSTVSAVGTATGSTIVFTINTNVGNPRQGDIWESNNVANLNRQGYVYSAVPSGNTLVLTVKSVQGAAVPLAVAIGDTVSFNTNAASEKSKKRTNQKFDLNKSFNKLQKFREFDSVTDVASVQGIEVEFNGQKYMCPYQHIQKKKKMEGALTYSMFAGQMSSTSFSDAAPFLTDPNSDNYAVQTSGGIDWYVTTYGIVDSAAILGTFGFLELEEICENLTSVKAPTNYMVISTDRAKRVLDNFFKNTSSSGVNSVRMMVNGKELDFNVDKVTYGKYTFEFINIPALDNPQMFGSNIRKDIAGSLYFIPKDDIEIVGDGNGRADRLRIRYQKTPFTGSSASQFSDGVTHEWRDGALANPPIGDEMAFNTHWFTEQAIEMLGAAHSMKYTII